MNWSALIPTFLITLREGVEAALVVGIVLAYLNQSGRSQFNRWVYLGIAAGLLASMGVGVLFNGSIWALSHSQQPDALAIKPLLEGVFGLMAIALLSWMLIWMTQQAKSLKGEIEGELQATFTTGMAASWGIFAMVFVAVLREGFETVLFIAAQSQEGWMPVLGAGLGLLSATLVGTVLFKWGVRINLRRFFQIMGTFLLLIVGGLVVGTLAHLDQGISQLSQLYSPLAPLCIASSVDHTCFVGARVWDLSQVLPDRQVPGIFLKTLFGYRDHLYLAEAVAYVGFLTTMGTLYFRSLTQRPLARPTSPAPRQPVNG
jgi:high-affinity iron transporter